MAYVDSFVFNKDSLGDIRMLRHEGNKVGQNWPVVYILNNDKNAYVGETVNAVVRQSVQCCTIPLGIQTKEL